MHTLSLRFATRLQQRRSWLALGAALVLGSGSLALAAPPAPAPSLSGPDLDLLVTHYSTSTGADGVRRTAEFSERFHRRAQMVWVSRVVPEHAHSSAEHARGHKEHKHLDLAAAARWIQRDEQGQLRLRLASPEDRVLIDITPTDYGNVGFDGSWPAAWSLIDPAVLKSMTAGARTGDTVTYTRTDAGTQVKVVWNSKLQHPISVESVGPNGSRKTTVRALPPPATAPWLATANWQRKDYSDYLD